jgi:tetratricopeptide (TPR) repeat protein
LRRSVRTYATPRETTIQTNDQGNRKENIQSNRNFSDFSIDEDDLSFLFETVDRLLHLGGGNDTDTLRRVDEQHKADFERAKESPIAILDSNTLYNSSSCSRSILPYEWVPSRELSLAARTLQPILSPTETMLIRKEAELLFHEKSSRFTYQFQGNSEAHVSDFQDSNVIAIFNRILVEHLEPWIRKAFFGEEMKGPLFVYDALVIRYNATASKTSMAGQPLHRDLGSVSINIMLNDGFQGGGTFFDNQLQAASQILQTNETTSFFESLQQNQQEELSFEPLKPLGVGYALAHRSSQRHAGAGTTQGVRDILVIFVATQHPRWMRNARLKQCRSYCEKEEACASDVPQQLCSLQCRIRHYRLAIDADLNDGEAYQYLGTALMELSAYLVDVEQNTTIESAYTAHLPNALGILKSSITALYEARKLTPCDARVYNNLAIAFRRFEQLTNITRSQEIESAYQQGFFLLQQSMNAGCSVVPDFDSLCLNYGLFLANQDRFADAQKVLAFPAAKYKMSSGESPSRLIDDAYGLFNFCGVKNVLGP